MSAANAEAGLNTPTASSFTRNVEIDASTLLNLHAARPDRYPVLLESAAASERVGRHDILMAFPGEQVTLDSAGLRATHFDVTPASGFLTALDQCWKRTRTKSSQPTALPFTGGWFLFLSYELAAEIEPSLQLPFKDSACRARAVRIPAAIVRRHGDRRAWIVAEAGSEQLIDEIAADLRQHGSANVDDSGCLTRGAVEEEPAERYLEAVTAALAHIAAGDVYQANLSRGWRARLRPTVQPHQLYRRLRRTNPAPFAGLALFEGHAIISSSPERLLEVRDGRIATRPIAGTRPRARDKATDQQLARELVAHPKERAEHIMLIDLERNDLGRICESGSVEVDELMTLETYAHVHHIVSNVRGRLRGGITPGQAIAAVFPGGTITGCPKVRCMQLIAALERTPRGAYTGSMGYLNLDGSMELNILIRTLEIEADEISFRAGAGIVADSTPERELDETRAKAQGLLQALEEPPAQ